MNTFCKRFTFCLLVILSLAGCAKQEKEAEHHEKEHVEGSGVLEISKEGQSKAGLAFSEVREDQITNLLRVSGKVVPDESRVIRIRPLAIGRVQKLFVTPGSSISKGQPLIAFDYVELGELQNSYAKARAAAEVTEAALKRAEHLSTIGALPRSEYEKRKADHENSLAEVKDIEFKLSRYNVSSARLTESGNLQESKITNSVLRSPRSGVLIKFEAAEGEVVDPEHELFVIADLSRIWVEANVHETDMSLIKVGQNAEIHSDAYAGQTFSGKITKIGDVLDVETRTVKVRCEVLNPQTLLKLEMFVHATIPTSQTRKALLVPSIAVQEIDHKPVVFVRKDDQHFEKRNIQTGEKNDLEIEVMSGVKAGEIVVSDGSFSLKSEFLKAEIGSDEHGH
jgi:cobalt-zinc-cadmium efflux system membrane fusion protein